MCILCDLSQGVLGYEIIISLWDICIAICLVRVVCERLTIMARKLIETLFTYCFVTYYGLMMFFVVLWQMIRRLAIPPRAKRRETRKWVGPMFVGHVVNFSCVYFTPYKHSSYALQWVDSSKESVLMSLLPSLFSLSLFGTIYPTDYCFYLQKDSWNVVWVKRIMLLLSLLGGGGRKSISTTLFKNLSLATFFFTLEKYL